VAISIPDRVVVFDYGEVISRSPSSDAVAELAALAGVEPAAFLVAWDRHRHALDQGRLSVTDYWRTMAAELGAEWTLAHLQRLWARDFTSWFEPEPAVVELLAELHEGGTRIALLSNAGFDFGDPFRFSPFGALMERVFVSAELDLVKPDPAIYRHVMSELQVEPTGMAFVDNKQVNVDAAAALGIASHRYVDAGGLRAFLEGLAG
jgi:putative hydrolase of the HAD superfamily